MTIATKQELKDFVYGCWSSGMTVREARSAIREATGFPDEGLVQAAFEYSDVLFTKRYGEVYELPTRSWPDIRPPA